MSLSKKLHLDSALRENRLVLHYRPRISSRLLQLVGAGESLRWNSGENGWIDAPATSHFSAEHFSRLWEWKLIQLERNFNDLKQLQLSSAPDRPCFFLSLKLSPLQLDSIDWAIQLLDSIKRAGISGSCVEVALMKQDVPLNDAVAEWSFEAVRQAGVSLTLGGFPLGRSSFLSLSRYKFDKVKIDKSLLPSTYDPLTVWSKRRLLLKGLISTINSLGIEVILDGIDRETHFNFFRELPVVEWQGLQWGPAIEFNALMHLLAASPKPIAAPPETKLTS
jgi:EAL domain-containing protein (putative c-di-GMP-specific phosphodiesterase class I)